MDPTAHSILDVEAGSRPGAESVDTRYELVKPFFDFPLAALMLLVSAPIILIALVLEIGRAHV